MQIGDESLQRISLASQGILVKILSNFAYKYILKLSRHRYAKRRLGFAKIFFHKSLKISDLASLHTLYKVRELAPMLQGYMLLCCLVVPG